jgi:hypothetical protein
VQRGNDPPRTRRGQGDLLHTRWIRLLHLVSLSCISRPKPNECWTDVETASPRRTIIDLLLLGYVIYQFIDSSHDAIHGVGWRFALVGVLNGIMLHVRRGSLSYPLSCSSCFAFRSGSRATTLLPSFSPSSSRRPSRKPHPVFSPASGELTSLPSLPGLSTTLSQPTTLPRARSTPSLFTFPSPCGTPGRL